MAARSRAPERLIVSLTVASFCMDNTNVVVVPAAAVVARVWAVPVRAVDVVADQSRFAQQPDPAIRPCREEEEEAGRPGLNTSWTSVGPPPAHLRPSVGDVDAPVEHGCLDTVPGCRHRGHRAPGVRRGAVRLDRVERALPHHFATDHHHLVAEDRGGSAGTQGGQRRQSRSSNGPSRNRRRRSAAGRPSRTCGHRSRTACRRRRRRRHGPDARACPAANSRRW